MGKKINIYTLCRSGNHCIIYWFLNNCGGITNKRENYTYTNPKLGLYYYNNCNHLKHTYINNYKLLIKSYEDMSNMPTIENDAITVIIIRDILNTIASRYKKYGDNLGLNKSYLQNIDDIISAWKKMAKKIINNKNIIGILYNKWLTDSKYRDIISTKLGKYNKYDKINYVPDIGHGSSFCGVKLENDKNSYLTRYKMVTLPQWIIDRLKNDKELCILSDKLFNMNINKLL